MNRQLYEQKIHDLTEAAYLGLGPADVRARRAAIATGRAPVGIVARRAGEAIEFEWGGMLLAVAPLRDLIADDVSVFDILDRGTFVPEDLEPPDWSGDDLWGGDGPREAL